MLEEETAGQRFARRQRGKAAEKAETIARYAKICGCVQFVPYFGMVSALNHGQGLWVCSGYKPHLVLSWIVIGGSEHHVRMLYCLLRRCLDSTQLVPFREAN